MYEVESRIIGRVIGNGKQAEVLLGKVFTDAVVGFPYIRIN